MSSSSRIVSVFVSYSPCILFIIRDNKAIGKSQEAEYNQNYHIPLPFPRTPNPSPIKFWSIERMLTPLKKDDDVYG
jgi:hypothetical protein